MITKLVRDRIPDIIERETGQRPSVIQSPKEFLPSWLARKLVEESHEFLASPNLNELADILEVLETLIQVKGWKEQDIQAAVNRKKRERGGFSKGYIVEFPEKDVAP